MKRFLVMLCLLVLAFVPSFANARTSSKKRIVSASEVQQSTRPWTSKVGIASFYHRPQNTASGEWFDGSEMTAAHKTIPLGEWVLVKNLRNGAQAILRINDRGPYIRGREIDVSKAGARVLGMVQAGLAKVQVTRLGRYPSQTIYTAQYEFGLRPNYYLAQE